MYSILACPPKTWAFDAQNPNSIAFNDRAIRDAVQNYHPYIHFPGTRLRQLNPLWSTSVVEDVGNGYDPPHTLEPRTAMVAPESTMADSRNPETDPSSGHEQPGDTERSTLLYLSLTEYPQKSSAKRIHNQQSSSVDTSPSADPDTAGSRLSNSEYDARRPVNKQEASFSESPVSTSPTPLGELIPDPEITTTRITRNL